MHPGRAAPRQDCACPGPADAMPPAHGRYQLSATLGRQTIVTHTDDLDAARAAFDAAFAIPHAGNRDAHGWIYDLRTLATVLSWRGGAGREPRPDPMLALVEGMIGSRTPTLVIHGGRAVEFGWPIPAGQGKEA